VRAQRRQRVLDLDVGKVDRIREGRRHLAVAVVVIHLGANAAAVFQRMFPAPGQVGAARDDVVDADAGAGSGDESGRGLALTAAPDVAVDAETVGAALPVAAHADLALVPGVVDGLAAGEFAAPQAEHLAVHAPAMLRAARAVAERGLGAVGIAAQHQHVAARVGRLPGNDVDHAVDRVHAPQSAAGTADHLDALDVFQHHVRLVPEHAREQRRIHRTPVDHHQQLVGRAVAGAVHAARGDVIAGIAGARHLQVGRQAQGFGQAAAAGAADVVRGDHEHRGRRILQALGALGYRSDFDIREFFDRQVGKVGLALAGRTLFVRMRTGGQGYAQQDEGQAERKRGAAGNGQRHLFFRELNIPPLSFINQARQHFTFAFVNTRSMTGDCATS
jgi:hypothetical protein